MSTRQSIYLEGFGHGGQPIPAAARVGNLLMTGGIHGGDITEGTLPSGVNEQIACMFKNLAAILEAGGCTLDHVVRITITLKSTEFRQVLNEHWVRLFSDPMQRPARHVVINEALGAAMLVQCEAVAFADD